MIWKLREIVLSDVAITPAVDCPGPDQTEWIMDCNCSGQSNLKSHRFISDFVVFGDSPKGESSNLQGVPYLIHLLI